MLGWSFEGCPQISERAYFFCVALGILDNKSLPLAGSVIADADGMSRQASNGMDPASPVSRVERLTMVRFLSLSSLML